MGWNRLAHPNESSLVRVFCVPKAILHGGLAANDGRCLLYLPKFGARVVWPPIGHAEQRAR